MFEWTLFRKKFFIDKPFQDCKTTALEWEQTIPEQKKYIYITEYFH